MEYKLSQGDSAKQQGFHSTGKIEYFQSAFSRPRKEGLDFCACNVEEIEHFA